MPLSLKIVIGSTRPGRAGPAVARWVAETARAEGAFEVELVDLAEVALPFLDEARHPAMQAYEKAHTKAWAATVAEADAFLFVTPEYDGFPPAVLVNALQVLAVEWRYKVAGIVSYGGVSGGLKGAQALRELAGNLSMMTLPAVPVAFFSEAMGEDGALAPNDKVTQGLGLMLGELQKWAGALHPLHRG